MSNFEESQTIEPPQEVEDHPPKDYVVHWKNGDYTAYTKVVFSALDPYGYLVLHQEDMNIMINRAECVSITAVESEF